MKTTQTFTRSLLCAAMLSMPLAGFAASGETESVQTIRTLVEQGQFERAYEHALAAEEAYEGDPEFDFHFGIAAIETGNYQDAIFALERVVFARPDQLRVRLELGRAHFLAGNYPAAQAEFERVREQDPPPAVTANIDRFMAQIERAQRSQRRDIALYIDGRMGVDSNINSATDANTINTPIGNFDLVEDGRETDDEFARIEIGGQWREPLSKVSSFDVAARWQQKENFSDDTFDLGLGTLDAGYVRQLENGRIRVGGRLQHVRLDDNPFQDGYGLVASYDRPLSDTLLLSLTGAATALRFEDDSGRDTDQYLGSASLIRPLGAYVHALTIYGADEPARKDRGEFNGRDFIGALYSLTYDGNRYQPYLRLGIQESEFDADNPVFAETRDDRILTGALGVRWMLGETLQLIGEANYTDVESNLPVFEYDRFVVEFGLRQAF